MASALYIDEEELEGRTVAKVIMDDWRIYLTFTDGTWTSITFGGGYYPGEGEMMFDEPGHYDSIIEKLAKHGIVIEKEE